MYLLVHIVWLILLVVIIHLWFNISCTTVKVRTVRARAHLAGKGTADIAIPKEPLLNNDNSCTSDILLTCFIKQKHSAGIATSLQIAVDVLVSVYILLIRTLLTTQIFQFPLLIVTCNFSTKLLIILPSHLAVVNSSANIVKLVIDSYSRN